MTIDWIHFTPWTSLAGGMLIGLAAALLILSSGRIAGISGILGGLLRPTHGDTAWRALFLLGLVLAPVAYAAFEPLPEMHVDAGSGMLLAAGLLVGIGTRYGAGCTSGHGVCGVARRSPRSLAATALFVCAGFVTVFLVRHASA
jgi:uncharacterized membrane protein YedE/YeeE